MTDLELARAGGAAQDWRSPSPVTASDRDGEPRRRGGSAGDAPAHRSGLAGASLSDRVVGQAAAMLARCAGIVAVRRHHQRASHRGAPLRASYSAERQCAHPEPPAMA